LRIERESTRIGLLALAASTGNAYLRRVEERRRRATSPLMRLIEDGQGGFVECAASVPADSSRPVLVFETGLGGSVDGWDWFQQALSGDNSVVRYFRQGHGRSRTRLRPGALVERILDELGLGDRTVHLVGHSLGGLVIANSLREFPSLAERADSVTLIDSTDADLLGRERADPEEIRRFRQYCFQEGLAAVTGLGRWTGNPVEAEVNLRSTSQRAFMTESSRPQTLMAAVREHAREPLAGQAHLATLPITKSVVSASDNVTQQRRLAEKLTAGFRVIPGSSHRSIIGRYDSAMAVVAHLRKVATT
jgi:pimeloyl-ACP methyl ester carboxylesterase